MLFSIGAAFPGADIDFAEMPASTNLTGATAFFLSPQTEAEGLAWLETIRWHPAAAVYLAPVLLETPLPGGMPTLASRVDATIDAGESGNPHALRRWGAVAGSILARISLLRGGEDPSLLLRVLRMAYTRQTQLAAVRNGKAPLGYCYPLVAALAPQDMVDTLKLLHAESLLTGEFVDKVHTCPSCQSSRLNFRETCPSCGSPDLDLTDLLHHFRCAYVGPASDFGPSDRKVCPKCGVALHQVGVDFDVSGTVAVCNSCGSTTQAPETDVLCLDCGAIAKPEDLSQTVIRSYELTASGETAALHGMVAMLRAHLEKELAVLPLDVFERIVKLERDRIQRYGKTASCLLSVQVNENGALGMLLGARAEKAYTEMGKAVAALLRKPDTLSLRGDHTLVVLLPETNTRGAELLAARLTAAIGDILEGSLGHKVPVSSEVVEVL